MIRKYLILTIEVVGFLLILSVVVFGELSPDYGGTHRIRNKDSTGAFSVEGNNFVDQFGHSLYRVDSTAPDQGSGTFTAGSTVKALVDSIGETKRATLVFTHCGLARSTDYTFLTAETIPSNITLIFESGARLSPAKGIRVTINGAIQAGNYQIFSGNGSISFGNVPAEFVNSMWWTGFPDGSTSNNTALQNAINACPVGAHLHTPQTAHDYIVENLEIIRPITWSGDGRGTVLKAKSDAKGYVIHVNGDNAVAVHNRESYLYGVVIENLMLSGNERIPDVGGLMLSSLDHCTFQTLWIERFSREAINCYTGVRESLFKNIHTRWNGNGDNLYPDINLKEQKINSFDAHNGNVFDTIFSGYTLGDHFLLDSISEASGDYKYVRHNKFINCFIHGLLSSQDGSGRNPFNITFSKAQKSGHHFDIGTAKHNKIIGCDLLTLGYQAKGVIIDSGSNGDPDYIAMIGNTIEGRYSYSTGPDAVNDIVIYLNKGGLVLDGNIIVGSGDPLASTVTTTPGTKLFMGMGNYISGTGPKIGGTQYTSTPDPTSLTYFRFMNLYGIGDLYCGFSSNNAFTEITHRATELTLSGTNTTWVNGIVGNSIVLGMSCRVTVEITGCTSFSVGEKGGDIDLFLDGIDVQIGTTANAANSNKAFTGPKVYRHNTDVLVTAAGGGGSFTGGKVRLTVHYLTLGAPSS